MRPGPALHTVFSPPNLIDPAALELPKVAATMAEQLASVPEESATGITAPCPPPNSYRESILSVGVVWPEWRVTSTHSSQSGHSGSNYSSDSGASRSNNSGYSSGSVFAGAADLGAKELTKIAQRMSSDGYLLRIFQTFIESSSSPVVPYDECCSLENWFVELDADWVLQRHNNHDLRQQLQEAPVSRLEEFVERWIRALTVILASIKELVAATHEMPAVVRFAKASISPMLIFVDAVVHVFELEKLQAALHTYVCVSNASYDMCTMHLISSEAPSFFSDIGAPLDRARQRLRWAISKKMWDLELELDHDDSWPIEILQGESKIHKNIRLAAECIVLMRKAHASTQKNSAGSHHTGKLIGNLIHNTTGYLKRLILAKSELCSNPSLRYMFLLNNSHFIAQVSEPSGHHQGLKLTPECQKHMDSYLDASWGQVLSCLQKSKFPGPLRHWISTSSLAKFESVFHQTYQAQKLWKVPDPRLRDVLRKTITRRVISGYGKYLKEHPRLQKHVGRESSSPEVLEEMLGELFEG